MDFDEQEEEMTLSVPASYDSLNTSSPGHSRPGEIDMSEPREPKRTPARYRECLKNHAVGIGGHAVDGCGEFIPAGEDGSLDALKCAACNCHRNFHRKETDATPSQFHHQFSPYYRGPPPPGFLHLPPPPHRPIALHPGGSGSYSRDEEDVSNPSSSGGGGGGGGGSSGGVRKRVRTKFTAEQKDKMMGFAERLGWRIQKHDETAVEEFCEETGVKRQVLKVWMHNNKHTIGKKP